MATATVVTYRQAGASGAGLLVMAFIFFGCSYIWEYDYNLFWTLQVVSYAFFFFALVSMCCFASLRRRASVQYVVTDSHHHHCHDQSQVIYAQQPIYVQQPAYVQQPSYGQQPSYVSPPPQQASVPAYNPQYPPPPSTYYKV